MKNYESCLCQLGKAWAVSFLAILLIFFTIMGSASGDALAQEKPNVVLVFMDNYGWGEPGVYGGGIIRGAPTPRIDKLAEEGMRLLNFNVEAQCTPSRAAIWTAMGVMHEP